MPENNTVERAEQRVREMDRLTRQFSEQGNRYMRNMQNMRNRNTANAVTVETVPDSRDGVHNNPQVRGQVSKTGTRFEPVERKREVPQKETKTETPKREEKTVPKNVTHRVGGRSLQNQGIDGEKLLLIALMYLLITENADIKLILAIGYLIL